MTNINNNLNQLYSLWTEKQGLKGTAATKKQKEIDDLLKDKTLFDSDGDKKITYLDLIDFANFDANGDGKTDATETAFINAMAAKITNGYSTSKDEKLKDADLDNIAEFVSQTKTRGNYYKSTKKLDTVLENISKALNKKLLGITTKTVNSGKSSCSTNLTQNNVNILTNLEAQLDAVNDWLNPNPTEDNPKPTEADMIALFGNDLSQITPKYAEQLQAAIDSVKTQIGVDTLSTSNQKTYDKYRNNSPVQTWEHAVAKQAFNSNGSYFDGTGKINFTLDYDITGDGNFDYKDIAALAKADFDGDGESTKEEKEVAAALQADILKKYKADKDDNLKNAQQKDLNDFMDAISEHKNIFSSENKLDKQLAIINENLNKNLFGTDTSNNINQKNVTAIANLEAKINAANAYLEGKLEKTAASLIFGADLNKINDEYINELKNNIKSIQQQLGIQNGDTSTLSASKERSYNKYHKKAEKTLEETITAAEQTALDYINDVLEQSKGWCFWSDLNNDKKYTLEDVILACTQMLDDENNHKYLTRYDAKDIISEAIINGDKTLFTTLATLIDERDSYNSDNAVDKALVELFNDAKSEIKYKLKHGTNPSAETISSLLNAIGNRDTFGASINNSLDSFINAAVYGADIYSTVDYEDLGETQQKLNRTKDYLTGKAITGYDYNKDGVIDEKDVQDLEQVVNLVRYKLNGITDEEINNFKTDYERLAGECSTLTTQKSTDYKAMNSLNSELTKLKNELSSSNSTITSIENDIKKYQGYLADAQNSKEKYEASNNTYWRDYYANKAAEYQTKIESLQTQLQTTQTRVAELPNLITAKETEYNTAKAKYNQTCNDLTVRNAEKEIAYKKYQKYDDYYDEFEVLGSDNEYDKSIVKNLQVTPENIAIANAAFKTDNAELQAAFDSLSDYEKVLINELGIDLTETFGNGAPKYILAKGDFDNQYHVYMLESVSSTLETSSSGKATALAYLADKTATDPIAPGNARLNLTNTTATDSNNTIIYLTKSSSDNTKFEYAVFSKSKSGTTY